MKIELDGFSVNCEISGKEDGPIVMMSHSLGCNLHMWDPQMAMMEPEFRVIRLDMRGHGKSDAPAGPYTLDALADDAIGVMDHLKINRAHWVGLSIGGMIGQSLCLRYPARIISAALCDTMSTLPEGGAALWEERVAKIEADGLGSIADGTMSRWFTPEYLAQNPPECQAVREQLAVATDAGYVACCRAIMGLNYIERLSEITTPISLIVGDQDMATPVEATEVMHDRIPDAEMTIIDHASHISNVEQTAAFNDALLPFLRSHITEA